RSSPTRIRKRTGHRTSRRRASKQSSRKANSPSGSARLSRRNAAFASSTPNSAGCSTRGDAQSPQVSAANLRDASIRDAIIRAGSLRSPAGLRQTALIPVAPVYSRGYHKVCSVRPQSLGGYAMFKTRHLVLAACVGMSLAGWGASSASAQTEAELIQQQDKQ